MIKCAGNQCKQYIDIIHICNICKTVNFAQVSTVIFIINVETLSIDSTAI